MDHGEREPAIPVEDRIALFESVIRDIAQHGSQVDKAHFRRTPHSIVAMGRLATRQSSASPGSELSCRRLEIFADEPLLEKELEPSKSGKCPGELKSPELPYLYRIPDVIRVFYGEIDTYEGAYGLADTILHADDSLFGTANNGHARARADAALAKAAMTDADDTRRQAVYAAVKDGLSSGGESRAPVLRSQLNHKLRDQLVGTSGRHSYAHEPGFNARVWELYEAGLFEVSVFKDTRSLASPGVAGVVASMIEHGNEETRQAALEVLPQLPEAAREFVGRVVEYISGDSERSARDTEKLRQLLLSGAQASRPPLGYGQGAPVFVGALTDTANRIVDQRNRRLPEGKPPRELLPSNTSSPFAALAAGEALRRSLAVTVADPEEKPDVARLQREQNRSYGIILDAMLQSKIKNGGEPLLPLAELCDHYPQEISDIIQCFADILQLSEVSQRRQYEAMVATLEQYGALE